MNIDDAMTLINKEAYSDKGLDLLFRMSSDIEKERITAFLTALKCLEEHYENKPLIERKLAKALFSLRTTLQASQKYWKMSHPKGLEPKICFEIHEAIGNVFNGGY